MNIILIKDLEEKISSTILIKRGRSGEIIATLLSYLSWVIDFGTPTHPCIYIVPFSIAETEK